MLRRPVLASLTVVFALVAVACSDGGSMSHEPLDQEVVPGWSPDGVRWQECDDRPGLDCATLTVPVDWDAPSGDTLELALVRQRAEGDRIGALLTNPGGPGASGIDLVQARPFGAALTDRFDIVGWDPRGVGESTAFGCDDEVAPFLEQDPDPDDAAEEAALDERAAAVAAECAAEDAALSANVGTDDVVRDLEAIRIALGERKLTYLGFSYGTLIGLRYLDLYGSNARAVVLDGIVDPTLALTDWLTQQAAALEETIDRAFASCDATCPVDDLAAAYDELKARVEAEPMTDADGRTLGPAELATGAIYVSYEPSLWPDLGDAIGDALDGDPAAMIDLAEGYYDFGGFTAYVAVECLDSEHPVGGDAYRQFARSVQEVAPRFGGAVANELLPCAFWDAPVRSIVGPVSGADGPPVLVLGNRGDAATPYENSVRIADMLDDGHLVSNDGEGHTSYGRSRCVDDVVHAYLVDLAVPDADPDCS